MAHDKIFLPYIISTEICMTKFFYGSLGHTEHTI